MNPWLIRIGLGIAVAAAAYFYTEWINRRNSQRSLNVHRNHCSYDSSSKNICCICLTEFKFIKKTEEIYLPCRHKVCRNCCIKMFSFQVSGLRTCPLCRNIVPDSFVSRILSS